MEAALLYVLAWMVLTAGLALIVWDCIERGRQADEEASRTVDALRRLQQEIRKHGGGS